MGGMTHVEALDRELRALGESDIAAAEVAAARGLARVLDEDPSLEWAWREYRFALKALKGVLSGGDVDEASALFDRLGGTDIRNSAQSG